MIEVLELSSHLIGTPRDPGTVVVLLLSRELEVELARAPPIPWKGAAQSLRRSMAKPFCKRYLVVEEWFPFR